MIGCLARSCQTFASFLSIKCAQGTRSVVGRFVVGFHMASSFPSHRDRSRNDTGECLRMSVLRRLPPANRPLRVLQRRREHPLRRIPPRHPPCHHHSVRLKRSTHSRMGTSSPPVLQLQLKMDIPQLGERRPRPQTPKRPVLFHNTARLVGSLVRHSPALPGFIFRTKSAQESKKLTSR